MLISLADFGGIRRLPLSAFLLTLHKTEGCLLRPSNKCDMNIPRNVALYVLLAIISAITACAPQPDVDMMVSDAETAAASSDYTEAVALCDRLISGADSSRLTVGQLCRLSLVYISASDAEVNTESNIASAIECFDRAYRHNPDSAIGFVEKLPLDRAPSARMLLQLIRNQGSDLSRFIDPEDPDHILDHDIDPDTTDLIQHGGH